jgi:UDP-glucuronate 4-epimerase
MKILLTGVAGFIGMHTAKRLLERGDEIVGVDNLNSYYAVSLKQDRLDQLAGFPAFSFRRIDIAERAPLARLFKVERPQAVVHLAAQSGVAYSIENPDAFVDSNLVGFANVVEACRHAGVLHFVYASSSSVYGTNRKMPLSVGDYTDQPISLYAATKKANEVMAHVYAHLFQIPTTGLRFFTVYGPWGRPDMAPSLFTRAILDSRPIKVFNQGNMSRDFTYIDDVVDGVVRVLDRPPSPQCSESGSPLPPYKLYNIGNNQPVGGGCGRVSGALLTVPLQNLAAEVIRRSGGGVVVVAQVTNAWGDTREAGQKLAIDPEWRDSLGARARSYAEANLDLEKIADQFEAVLTKAAQRRVRNC